MGKPIKDPYSGAAATLLGLKDGDSGRDVLQRAFLDLAAYCDRLRHVLIRDVKRIVTSFSAVAERAERVGLAENEVQFDDAVPCWNDQIAVSAALYRDKLTMLVTMAEAVADGAENRAKLEAFCRATGLRPPRLKSEARSCTRIRR